MNLIKDILLGTAFFFCFIILSLFVEKD